MTTMRKFQLFFLIISITCGTKAKTAIARDVPGNRGPSYQQHAQKTLSPVQSRKTISSETIQINSNIGHIIPERNSSDDKIVENDSKPIKPVNPTHLKNELPLPTHVPPSEIFRFELSDAAIPNRETAELINQGRVRLSKDEMFQQDRQTDQRDMFTDESRASHQIQKATQNEQAKITKHENRKTKSISELGYSNQAHALPRYGYVRYQAVPVKLFKPNQKENSYQQWWKQPAKNINPYKSYRSALKPFSPSIEYPNNSEYPKNNLYEYKFESPPPAITQYSQNPQYDENSFKPSSYDNLYHNPIPFVIEVPDKKLEYTASNYLHSQTEALTQLIGKPAIQQLHGLNNLLQYDQPQRQQDSTAPVLFPLGARLPKPKENQTESILNTKKAVATEAPVEVPQEEPVSYALVPFYVQEDQKPIIEESMEEEVINVHQPNLPSVPVQTPQEPVVIFHELSPLPKDLNKPYASGYKFGYRVRDHHTGNDFGHTQNRDTDGVTRGEYHTLLPDGRLQTVWYTADKKGFHADVSYNGEPPTKHADG